MGRVQGLVAIITGGAQGLGRADAVLLAAEGASVVLTDLDEERGRATAQEIGESAIFLKHDVRNEDEWRSIVAETVNRFGRLDILVNNAGLVLAGDVETETLERFRLLNSVMSEGVFLGCKHAIPAMTASGGGSIINISSVAGIDGYAGLLAYAAAKGAVRAMSKSVAVYCQDKGNKIRCNSVHPGGIETAMVQFIAGRDGQQHAVPEGVLPAGAYGAPKDIAHMVLYLASPESRFVTGAEFVIDNGNVIRP